jgi:hypothetical protein
VCKGERKKERRQRASHPNQTFNKNQVLARSEQPTRPVDLRDDEVDIDLPSREVTDSIAAELLKNGEPNLVDALHEVRQQAWTSETLPSSWTEGILCQISTSLQN